MQAKIKLVSGTIQIIHDHNNSPQKKMHYHNMFILIIVDIENNVSSLLRLKKETSLCITACFRNLLRYGESTGYNDFKSVFWVTELVLNLQHG